MSHYDNKMYKKLFFLFINKNNNIQIFCKLLYDQKMEFEGMECLIIWRISIFFMFHKIQEKK